MDEQMKQEILKWLEGSRDLIAQEAPKAAEEVIRWGIIGHSFGAACGVAIALFAAWFVLRVGQPRVRDWDILDNWAVATCLVGSIGAALSLPLILANAYYAIMAWVVPRAYLIEKLAG